VSQSPREALRLQRYLDGWEIINRMIREDTSWGGRERSCFHLGCGDGSFVDISSASRLDFIEDGRALARLDLDRDGRPDLVLRNRNAPQLRILRNCWPHVGRALWLRLEGRRSNRDAIGARVTVEIDDKKIVREVTAGRAFISQSSRWLSIGLGDSKGPTSVTVRWPGGRIDEHPAGLDPASRWILVEGEPPRSEPFARREDSIFETIPNPLASTGTPRRHPPSSSVESWLLDPLPAPSFGWPDDATPTATLLAHRGKPLVIHLVSRDCSVCVEKIAGLVSSAARLDAAGARVLFVSVDTDVGASEALTFLSQVEPPAMAIQATDKGLAAWNVVHRRLFNWRRDLVVPTSFLVDEQGRIVKIYRGRTPTSSFVRDLRQMPRSDAERRSRALPFSGRTLHAEFRRDLIQLAAALTEAGLPTLARATYAYAARVSGDRPANVETMFNVAITAAASGDVSEARRLYTEILRLRPDFDDALNNLGVLALRDGRVPEARRQFRQALSHNPANVDAALNLANTYLDPGAGPDAARRALTILEDILRHDPEAPRVLARVWNAHYILGDRAAAIRSLDEALRVDPSHGDSYLNLSILLIAEGRLQKAVSTSREGLLLDPTNAGLRNTLGMSLHGLGRTKEGIAELHEAIRTDPFFDRPYLNLAGIHADDGDPALTTAVLRELLRALPGHPKAIELLRQAGER